MAEAGWGWLRMVGGLGWEGGGLKGGSRGVVFFIDFSHQG